MSSLVERVTSFLVNLPRWAWVLLGGAAAITVGTLLAYLLLPPTPFPRALWSTIQVGLALYRTKEIGCSLNLVEYQPIIRPILFE